MKRARKKKGVAPRRPTWHRPKAVVPPPELAWWMFALLEKPKADEKESIAS